MDRMVSECISQTEHDCFDTVHFVQDIVLCSTGSFSIYSTTLLAFFDISPTYAPVILHHLIGDVEGRRRCDNLEEGTHVYLLYNMDFCFKCHYQWRAAAKWLLSTSGHVEQVMLNMPWIRTSQSRCKWSAVFWKFGYGDAFEIVMLQVM